MGKVLNWVKEHKVEVAEVAVAGILAGGCAYVYFKLGYKVGFNAGYANGFKDGRFIGLTPIFKLMDDLDITPSFNDNGKGMFALVNEISDETKAKLIEEGFNHIADITFAVK